jgi:hypothetical protein
MVLQAVEVVVQVLTAVVLEVAVAPEVMAVLEHHQA